MTDIAWTAHLAPMEVVTADGRLLESDGQWDMSPETPLLTMDRERVGQVTRVAVEDGVLCAWGTVTRADLAGRMASRDLQPQVEFSEDVDAVVDVYGVIRFSRGRIAAVVLGSHPAWDEVCFVVGSGDAR